MEWRQKRKHPDGARKYLHIYEETQNRQMTLFKTQGLRAINSCALTAQIQMYLPVRFVSRFQHFLLDLRNEVTLRNTKLNR